MKQPYMQYQKFIKSGKYNNSDMIMNNGFWVGLYPGLTKEDLNNISYHLHYFIKKVNN
jgi:CDP-6-deoxy-D-xylo-4-hexulose-3-dehydrase